MNYKELIPERWRSRYDRNSDRWLILDTWHEQIQNVADLTQDIPDNHPAVKIVSGGELNSIFGELRKMNKLDVIKETKRSDIISNDNMSNLDIANTLEKIAKNLRDRRNKKFQQR